MALFKKAAVFTDIHWGAKNNSDTHINDCMEFTQWFCKTAKEQNCDVCFFLGDYHNTRSTMSLKTMKYAHIGLEILNENFSQIFFIPGNHDQFFKDSRDIISTPWAKHLPNITIINEWFTQDDVVIAPWIIGNDHERLEKLSGKYIFGHFEIPGFYMNSQVKMPDHGTVKNSQFKNFDHCFTGHFHKRQTSKNITYIGNAFPHNYADAGDDERGMMILEWGQNPTYIAWPEQPTFRTMLLSTMLENADTILKPKQYVRAIMDLDISFEDGALIKNQYIADYNLRELSFLSQQVSFDVVENDNSNIIEPVDKTISVQIGNIESDKFNTSMLLNIWRDL